MIRSILQNLVMSEMGAEFIEAAPYQPILVETPSVDDQVCLVILKEFFFCVFGAFPQQCVTSGQVVFNRHRKHSNFAEFLPLH